MIIQRLLQLSNRPFPSHPQVSRYFPAKSIDHAREQLVRTISRGEGPGLVIGSAGTGKSLLMQVLAAQFQGQFDIVLLACAQLCTRRALLQAILFELELPYHRRDEGEIRLSLLDHLLSPEQCPKGLLLLIDEAQSLPIHLMEELRIITNMVRDGQPRVRLVLAGSSALEESFASPELESFNQRLAARCYLTQFSREETFQYVRAQIAASGVEPDSIIASDAWDALFEATDGVPRLVNQLCDRALLAAEESGCQQIDRPIVQRAWANLQQLPTPWEAEPKFIGESTSQNVVEFGSLIEDEDLLLSNGSPNESMEQLCPDLPPEIEETEIDEEDDLASIEVQGEQNVVEQEAQKPLAVLDANQSQGCCGLSCSGQGYSEQHRDDVDEFPEEKTEVEDQEYVADDPFADQFEEEEVILDHFSPIAGAYHAGTPQVINQHEPELAALLHIALESSVSPNGDSEDAQAESLESPVSMLDQQAASLGISSSEPQSLDIRNYDDEDLADVYDETVSHVHLAGTSDLEPLQPIPLDISVMPDVVSSAAAFDPVLPDDERYVVEDRSSAVPIAVVKYPKEEEGLHSISPSCEEPSDFEESASSAVEEVLIVVDDEPVDITEPAPAVGRVQYSQLFAKLRGSR